MAAIPQNAAAGLAAVLRSLIPPLFDSGAGHDVAMAGTSTPWVSDTSTPSVCKPHHSTLETSLSLFLCMGLVVSYLPQIVRIIWKKSSVGFSPWFLFLGATSSASSFLNVVSLQWAIVSCCRWLSYGACLESLLGIVQVGLQWLLFMTVFALYLAYYPKELRFERSIALAGADGHDDSESSEDDLDSLDSHIAENYAENGLESGASNLSPSAFQQGAAASGTPPNVGNYGPHSPDESAFASRITLDDDEEGDERSSSAFSRLVPTFWPVWKAPRKYAPSPLSNAAAQGSGEQLPANATAQARLAASSATPSGSGSLEQTEPSTPDHANGADHSAHVRIQLPSTLRRKRRGTKVRSQEWNLALSLAWLVAFHFVFILSVTLLLVSSLPPTSFPQPPSKGDDLLNIMGPSSRLLVTRWATFLGWTAMLLAACQYLPQIAYTARNKLVGSLSIPMMCLQVPGSALFIYSLALKPGVNYTSLAAYICTGVLQSVLLGLCVAWRLRQKRLGIDDYGRPLEGQESGLDSRLGR